MVAAHLNLRKASEQLHISEPSVSRQLKLLEDDLKLTLHAKVGRGIQLTKEGKLFLKDAQALLSQAEKLREKFSRISLEPKVGSLTVGGSYNPSATLLPSVLALFEKRHPVVDLTLRTHGKRAIERMIVNGEIDIAVMNSPPQSPELTTEPLRREKLVAFALPSHPLARRGSLAISDLADTRLVIRGERESGMSTTEEMLTLLRGFAGVKARK